MRRTQVFRLSSEDKSAVFDANESSREKREEYLNYFGAKPAYFISRNQLCGSLTGAHRVIHVLFISLFVLPLIPFSLSRRRVNYALLLTEMVEWVNLYYVLKTNRITQLYHFCIYEKDSNFLAYWLQKKEISVSKIPSEVPLTFANKIVIADELCLCFPYQHEEVKMFHETMFVNKLSDWLPEMQISYINQYKDKNFEVPVNRIGYYSGAFWFRVKMNHSIADIGSYDVEHHLLQNIASYLEARPNINLLVFLHPHEKKNPAHFEETKQYYRTVFGEELLKRVEFTEANVRSTDCFHLINIGLSVFSTIVFERLSLGFKTLLAPMEKTDFPLENSPFRNICCYTKEQLFSKLDENLKYNKEEFFCNNKIDYYFQKDLNINYSLS
jgi:hypothetical protein